MFVCCFTTTPPPTPPATPSLDRARPNHTAPARSQTQRLLRRRSSTPRYRESDTLARIVESRQLRAQLQPNGLPSPWPGALHTELRRSRSATSRGRCDAGRVLSDHRVLIALARPFSAGLLSSPGERHPDNWFVRPRDRHHAGDGLSDSSTRCALRSRYQYREHTDIHHRHLCVSSRHTQTINNF